MRGFADDLAPLTRSRNAGLKKSRCKPSHLATSVLEAWFIRALILVTFGRQGQRRNPDCCQWNDERDSKRTVYFA